MITKSKYVSFCRCPRLYYLNEYHKEEARAFTEFEQQTMDQGTMIGDLARSYFGDYTLIERDNNSNMGMYNDTLNALNRGDKVICEASFIYEDLFCAVDILKVNEDKSLEIYEVKSSSHVEEYQKWDASFQYYVLTKLGYKVNLVNVMIVNNKYIFHDSLDIKKMMKPCEFTLFTNIEENIKKIRKLESLPSLCANKECKECVFFDYCYKHLPEENIYKLSGLKGSYKLYNEGIVSFKDYLNSKYAIKTTKTNKKIIQQIMFEYNDCGVFVDKKKVNKFLDRLLYPIYYLDFETVRDVVPFINNTNAGFSRIFQYSLHIQEYKNGPVIHKEYLQDGKYDNLQEVADRLVNDLGESGTILTYNSSYESGHIHQLANLVVNRKEELESLRERIDDLEIPFKNRWIYCKEMRGRSSIKYVLPSLVEGFEDGYKSLPYVHNGIEAMSAYNELLDKDNPRHEFIYDSLLKYCEMDTLAMVKILEKVCELVE